MRSISWIILILSFRGGLALQGSSIYYKFEDLHWK